MSAISIAPYRPSDESLWNAFNKEALNGHFLFDRGFMEYHADRFTDASLMVLRGDELVGLFPANLSNGQLHSHQGLTFGGLVHGEGLRLDEVVEAFDAIGGHARTTGAEAIVYKALPAIYHRAPAEAGLYGLFRSGATCFRRDASATIDYRAPGQRSSRRRRSLRKSQAAGLELVWDEAGWEEYWQVLTEVLVRRHGRPPVHTAGEIQLLASRFPDNLKLLTAKKDGETVAGVVMFETPQVAHAQYISAGPLGQELSALDAIFDHLIGFYADTKRYFDFGISTEDEGRRLNVGLSGYKQEWGAGSVMHDIYRWTL